jgi:hypothetical protein
LQATERNNAHVVMVSGGRVRAILQFSVAAGTYGELLCIAAALSCLVWLQRQPAMKY